MASKLIRLFLLFCVTICAHGTSRAQDLTTSFAERFALAQDRLAALQQLVPGSDDYFYYSCLQRQHEGAFAAVQPLLDQWIRAHGRSARTMEIEHRQALLTFDQNPDATYNYLRSRLDVGFEAKRGANATTNGGLDLATALDPEVISRDQLDKRALEVSPGSVASFEPAALRRLATTELSDAQLLSLLERLERPDLPNLPTLVARGLALPNGGGFGSVPIHAKMLLAQLEELVRLRPQLIGNAKLIDAWLRRLHPSTDVDWRHDNQARLAYLKRLQAFADRLPPTQASLQVHVRYHRLQHDLAAGTLDRERLLAYLRLPRTGAHIAPEHQRQFAGKEAKLSSYFPTGLNAVHNDEELVHACLVHFFAAGDDWQIFAPYVEQTYLEEFHAKTQLLLGRGDAAQWYAVLGPQAVEHLQNQVTFDFAATQPTQFASTDPVVIEADVKNINQLLVKVFAIDTYDYERDHGREVGTSLDLDGLVANEERVVSYDSEPLRRVRRRFEFAALTEPGTYVIEFLGGGLASRALIRKGRLNHVARIGAAGHVLTVLDEDGAIVPDATAWCAGREYTADQTGKIVIPFAAERRPKERLVLRHNRLTALASFDHLAEQYHLDAGIFVPRESLLSGSQAKILIRPTLLAHGIPIALSLLEDAALVITARDFDGIETTQTVRDLALTDDAELVHEIHVPPRLRTLHIALRGEVGVVTTGERTQVTSNTATFARNEIDTTAETNCLLLGQDGAGYYIEARGRNGEAVAGVGMRLYLTSRDHNLNIEAMLQTGSDGRARLGILLGIARVEAQALDQPNRYWGWSLASGGNRATDSIDGIVGQTLRVPHVAQAANDRSAMCLFEVRNGALFRDASAQIAMASGFVELRQLAAGDYQLFLPGNADAIEVRITEGVERAGWAIGASRAVELPQREPLQITTISNDAKTLTVQLANASEAARVHAFATRYPTTYDPLQRLQTAASRRGARQTLAHPTSDYRAGRQIGDEYRYVLDRRFQTKFPGNMLRRPGLLLNPWRLEPATDFDSDQWNSAVGLGGGRGGARGGRSAKAIGSDRRGSSVGLFADLDFLPTAAPLLANLRPDRDGVVRVPLAQLGTGHTVHIVAIDHDDTAYRTTLLPEPALTPRDRRLLNGLDPASHFTEQRRVEFVAAGATVTIENTETAELVRYDSVAHAFELLQTLSGNSELAQFEWLTRWPSLSTEEQQRLYSEHACHEVHFFLFLKDRAFFDRVIQPYLANKLDKTFLDDWLLGNELSSYTDPWAFSQLNIVEQILLTRRVAGLREAGARRVGEQAELATPDAARTAQLFRQLLAGRALSQPASPNKSNGDVAKRRQAEFEPEPPPAPEANDGDADNFVEELVTEEAAKADAKNAPETEDLERRRSVRQVYRPPGATQTYAENNYWQVPAARQNATLITANDYWRDYALVADEQAFASEHLAQAAGSVAEMLMALAVLDLPFAAKPCSEQRDGDRLTLTATTPLLLARKELRVAGTMVEGSQVLIGQSFTRIDANAGPSKNRGPAAIVRDEFVAGVPYACQVAISNPSATEIRLDLLLQIPRGALPLRGSAVTRGVPVALAPFSTETFNYAFYLPTTGDFEHFPAHAARASDGALLAAAEPVVLHVVATPTVLDTTSWPNVARDGSEAEVLTFLDTHNLARLDLSAIAWRMRDAAFFGSVLDRLRTRLCYADSLWAYGLLHKDRDAVREWLAHRDEFVSACGAALRSPLLEINPVARHSYQHVEFAPLVHARAHALGNQPINRNNALTTQYQTLLNILCHRPQLDAHDWMSVTCYLLQQDRIAEGLKAFARVDAAALPARLQYDYFRCYLDFFSPQPAIARSVAERYRDYPVARWQQLFADVLAQLDEAASSANGAQTELVATEPALDLAVSGSKVTLRYQNLAGCTVSCYPLDLEFAFSTAPFGAPGSDAASYVVPNHEVQVQLPEGQREFTLELPERFRRSDVLVEATAAGITRRRTSLDNALAVQTIEGYGQLQVRHATTGQPLPKVYVKVYAELQNGKIHFHKDGYTDLRGRFDYSSLSNNNLRTIQRFAVLVLSETHGAQIHTLQPPR